MALRYEFLENFKPEIYIKINAPENFNDMARIDKKELSRKFSAKLTETLNDLKTDVVSKNIDNYEIII